MAPATYQTIRLRRGKHKSPDEGACVMELASMLAGEPFSDHPVSVCPVIGAFLRRYNDASADDRRQDLYCCAAAVVGTRASEDVQRARLDRLVAWTAELRRRRRKRYWLPERWRSLAYPDVADEEIVAGRAIHEIARHGERIHVEVLALVDELIALGTRPARTRPEDAAAASASLVLASP
jgi:hypothetical protein